MFTLLFDNNTLNCFSEFLALYLDDVPELTGVKKYMEHKCEEKEIVGSYNAELITQDEFCSFLMTHMYTKFIMDEKNIRNVSDDEIKDINQKMRLMLFG